MLAIIIVPENSLSHNTRWLACKLTVMLTDKDTHPAMRKMTRSGSLAIVNKNKAMAGPNAMNVQPKKTAAVIL